MALKYTQTAGKDDGCVSGKFKVADDTEATVAYDLDGFNGLDVNKFSGVLKYKYDDGCDASISYHARDKRSVLRVTHKIDSVNKLEVTESPLP